MVLLYLLLLPALALGFNQQQTMWNQSLAYGNQEHHVINCPSRSQTINLLITTQAHQLLPHSGWTSVTCLPNCWIALSALHGNSSVICTRRRWFIARLSACRDIPELAASDIMAMFCNITKTVCRIPENNRNSWQGNSLQTHSLPNHKTVRFLTTMTVNW